MTNTIKRLFVEETGAAMTEYALLLGVLALGLTAGAFFLQGKINDALNQIGNRVNNCAAITTGPSATAC